MKKLTMLVLLGFATLANAAPWIGRVPISSPEDVLVLREQGFPVYHDEIAGVVDLVFDESGLQRLLDLGYQPQNLIPLAEVDLERIDPEYHTYEEMTAELLALETQYPSLCKVDSIGRATQFPRTMWAVKLSDNVTVEEDELAVLYVSQHHGCEIMGLETMLYLINHFLDNYGIDPQITSWMNSYEIFIVPMMNPDGHYAITQNINLFWRKNARDIDGDSIYYEYLGSGTWWTQQHEGIDLNRNYDWYWSQGGSSNPWYYDYRGTAPFSESENQAIRYLANQRFVAAISFHSYGDVIISPWTFGGQPAPDQDVLNSIAAGLSTHFLDDAGQPFDWYPDNGQNGRFPNWFYGYAGSIAYDIELLPYPLFIAPGSQLAERTQRYYNGAVYLIERLTGPGLTGHVRDAITNQPLPARVEIQGRISPQVRPRFAEPQYGRFTRLLNNGTYTVLAGMTGYQIARVQNVVVNNSLTPVEIQLVPIAASASSTGAVNLRPKAAIRVSNQMGGQATFMVNLSQPMRINLRLYNVQGREIAEIASGDLEAGTHQLGFTSGNLPSGVYFARLTGEGVTEVAKVVLLK